MEAEKIIEVKDLTAKIEEKVILSDISFHVIKGEVTVILGSSGSGKTTLLKHLLGLYPSRKESVSVLNRNPAHLGEDEARAFYTQLGVFYQNGALLSSLTVGENVALPLNQHTSFSEEMIERLVRLKLKLVELEGSYNKFPSQLSGGMLKRAALARAIIMDPPLLFCDEPGAGLDPVSLASLDQLIKNLQKLLGITIVLVTHEVSSILRIADRIVFLDNGKIIFQGPLEKALKSDLNPLVQFFTKGKGD